MAYDAPEKLNCFDFVLISILFPPQNQNFVKTLSKLCQNFVKTLSKLCQNLNLSPSFDCWAKCFDSHFPFIPAFPGLDSSWWLSWLNFTLVLAVRPFKWLLGKLLFLLYLCQFLQCLFWWFYFWKSKLLY